MAGSAYPDSQTVEITRDEGKTFEHLAEIPWGRPTEPEIIGPCVVILGIFHKCTHEMVGEVLSQENADNL